MRIRVLHDVHTCKLLTCSALTVQISEVVWCGSAESSEEISIRIILHYFQNYSQTQSPTRARAQAEVRASVTPVPSKL